MSERRAKSAGHKATRKQAKVKGHPPGEMLMANLLAMLNGWSAYGYELMQRLEKEGLGAYNAGTIYRSLRQMEKDGWVSSMWDTTADGPARRVYSLTKAGSLFLSNWISVLEAHQQALERFMGFSQKRGEEDEAEEEEAPPKRNAGAAKRRVAR